MKKKLLIVSLVIMMFFVQGCSGKDLTAGLTDEEIVGKAIEATMAAESVAISSFVVFNVDSVYQPIDAEVSGQAKIYNNPMLVENNFTVINKTTNQTEEYKNYIHLINNEIIGYVFQNGEWFYGENLILPEEIVNNPTMNLTLFSDNPSANGFVTRDEEGSSDNLVKFDLAADPSIYTWALNQSFLSVNLGNFVQDPVALEALGDFVLSAWVNKSTLNIEKIEIDFSKNLNRLGNYLQESESAPENLVELFQKFTYKVTYDLKDHNKLERFSVPLEARVGTKIEY